MRKNYSNLIIFIVTLFLLGGLNVMATDKPSVSQLENRILKAKPQFTREKLLSGAYFREYEEYFADNFIFRESLVQLNRVIKELRGLPGQEGAALVTHQGANVFQGEGEQGQTAQTQGRVLVLGDKGMELHRFNEEASRYYGQVINSFSAKLAEKVKVSSILVPTQIEFAAEDRYRNLSSPQKDTINFIYHNYDPKVQSINVYDALRSHIGEYIYFRTDHHWTALGAYWAYTEFIKSRGEEPIPLERYETGQINSFLGSTYSTTLSEKLKANPDQVIYYKPLTPHKYEVIYQTEPVPLELLDLTQAEQNNKYGVFLGGDQPLGVITTNIENNKRILVIKDSYGNAFVPFLLPHYQEIYVLDPRLFNQDISKLINDKGINEVLFINYVLSTDNKGFAELIAKLLKS